MTAEESSIKQKLFSQCVASVDTRMASIKEAIQLAQASANEETKSSAGDKYETGRAMAQLEIENGHRQLEEAIKLKQALEQIDLKKETASAQLGSLVFTTSGNYYLAISLGKLVIDEINYYAISPASPIGSKLMGLKAGTTIIFNAKEFRVERIV